MAGTNYGEIALTEIIGDTRPIAIIPNYIKLRTKENDSLNLYDDEQTRRVLIQGNGIPGSQNPI